MGCDSLYYIEGASSGKSETFHFLAAIAPPPIGLQTDYEKNSQSTDYARFFLKTIVFKKNARSQLTGYEKNDDEK